MFYPYKKYYSKNTRRRFYNIQRHFFRWYKAIKSSITRISGKNTWLSGCRSLLYSGRLAAMLTPSAEILQFWGAPALLAGVIISAFLGALIGKKIVKKHLLPDM